MRKVIFLGTPKFAVPILDRISKNELDLVQFNQCSNDQQLLNLIIK